MDWVARVKRRDANIILVAFAGVSGAVIAHSLPTQFYEMLVTTSGIAKIIPAAAPPLGETASLAFMGAGALIGSAAAAIVLPWHQSGGQRNSRMSFIFSKLAFFRRGNSADPGVSIRRSDAHPDAPARRPVFASTELGPDALPPVDAALEASDDAQPMVKDITGLSMPRAPEPMPWDMIQEEMDRLVAHARERAQAFAEKSVADSPVAASLSDLADRLELGLARRRDAVAAQAGLSQSDADATAEDMAEKSVSLPHGEKLDEALAALRGIAARGA